MSHGAHHSQRLPDGKMVTNCGGEDGRYKKRKNRDREYYVRLNQYWFDRLEGLLDVPVNRAAHSHIAGCVSRADLIEKGFAAFLQIDALAREMNYRDVDDLVTQLIEGFQFLQRKSAAPAWLSIEQPGTAQLTSPAMTP